MLKNSIFLAVAVLVSWGSYNMVRQALTLRAESRNTGEKVEELLKKKQELEAYIAELEDPRTIEREAKERLNLKLAGEEVVVVVPPAEKKPDEEGSLFTLIKDKVQNLFNFSR